MGSHRRATCGSLEFCSGSGGKLGTPRARNTKLGSLPMKKDALRVSAWFVGGAAAVTAAMWLLKRPSVKKKLNDLIDDVCTRVDQTAVWYNLPLLGSLGVL